MNPDSADRELPIPARAPAGTVAAMSDQPTGPEACLRAGEGDIPPAAPHVFRDAQISNARIELAEIDLDTLPEPAREQVERAVAALSARPEGNRIPMDVGVRAQQAVEEHMERCHATLYEEEEGEEVEWPDTAGPFCGCSDCEIRETLHAAWAVFEADTVVRIFTAQAVK